MTKLNGQLPLLCGRGIEPEFVGTLCYRTATIIQLMVNNNAKRASECAGRYRTQKTATGISEERKPHAIQFSRDSTDYLRETRIYGEMQVIGPRACLRATHR
jgi:hypothetical protein